MKCFKCGLIVIAVVLLLLTGGCHQSQTKALFQKGQIDQIRFVRTDSYHNWLEMPNQPPLPDTESMRLLTEEVILTREVEQVNSDGSVILKVTFDQVRITDKRKFQGTENIFHYTSTPEEITSTSPAQPSLAGGSYRVKIAPDTTVQEIIGLDQLRQEKGITEGAAGLWSLVLEENRIKACHEREFLQSGVQYDKNATKLFPVRHEMNKAKALEKTFSARHSGAKTMLVSMTGEAVYVLPEGWAEPPQPQDPFRPFLKENSDMQPPTIIGEGIMDLASNQVVSDQTNISCLLILTEDKVTQSVGNETIKSTDGLMFTEINLEQKFETISK